MSSMTPITGWVARPVLISSSATRLAWLTGMAKPSPMGTGLAALEVGAAVGGADGAVDADDAGPGVEEGAAGVAGIDGRVGLQRVDVRDVAPVALLAPPAVMGRSLALMIPDGDGVGEVEGRADGDDGVAHLDAVGVAQRHGPARSSTSTTARS